MQYAHTRAAAPAGSLAEPGAGSLAVNIDASRRFTVRASERGPWRPAAARQRDALY